MYKYNELTDETAKERARDWYRERCLDYDWWGHVCDTAKEAGAILGIDIDRIYFSGFYSQGDGACFEGNYSYHKGWRKSLRESFGGDLRDRLERIGDALQEAQSRNFYCLTAYVSHKGHYMHSGCTDISVHVEEHPSGGSWMSVGGDQETVASALREFMDWIYECLEAEHDYLTSDEIIEEGLIANEYEFTEEGVFC